MKIAKVIPVFKTGKKNILSNYRPISVLSQFSKILEKLFDKRLKNFLKKHNILSENQYGFQCGKSTESTLTEIMEEISAAIDNKMSTIGVFIDVKKAFDTINHSVLIDKLEHYGVRGTAKKWIMNYLSGRQQYVHIDNVHSGFKKVMHGIPQGSILGPRLFITYINDMCNASSFLKYILFADDTTIFRAGNDIKLLNKEVNQELIALSQWFSINKFRENSMHVIYKFKIIQKYNNYTK